MMLAWLTTSAICAFFRTWLTSNSIPTMNMNRQTPIWLSNCKVPNECAGKIKLNAWGHSQPSKDGPSKMPAAISPMTAGCPNLRNIAPTVRVAARMTMNCSKRRLRGLSRFACKADQSDEGLTDDSDTRGVMAAKAPLNELGWSER